MQKYLHVAPIDKAQVILDTGVIDNTQVPVNETFMWKDWWEFVVQVWNAMELVKAFMWDIDQIKESGYTRTAPWEDQEFVDKRFRAWKHLWCIPRFVHRYEVEKFRAITFDVSRRVQDTIFDMYMVDQDDGTKHYFESATHLSVEMQSAEERDIEEICQEVLWMKPPYITRKFKEGHKAVFDRDLVSDSPIKAAPLWTTQRLKYQ